MAEKVIKESIVERSCCFNSYIFGYVSSLLYNIEEQNIAKPTSAHIFKNRKYFVPTLTLQSVWQFSERTVLWHKQYRPCEHFFNSREVENIVNIQKAVIRVPEFSVQTKFKFTAKLISTPWLNWLLSCYISFYHQKLYQDKKINSDCRIIFSVFTLLLLRKNICRKYVKAIIKSVLHRTI